MRCLWSLDTSGSKWWVTELGFPGSLGFRLFSFTSLDGRKWILCGRLWLLKLVSSKSRKADQQPHFSPPFANPISTILQEQPSEGEDQVQTKLRFAQDQSWHGRGSTWILEIFFILPVTGLASEDKSRGSAFSVTAPGLGRGWMVPVEHWRSLIVLS